MTYSADILRQARRALEEKKTAHEAAQQARLQEIYEKLPRVREIDRQLRVNMAQAAQAAFSRETADPLARARAENLALQAERKALIAGAFSPEYLHDGPVCDKCGGSGYVGSAMCACLAELCCQEQKKALSLLSAGDNAFADFRLDFYPDRVDPKHGVSPRAIMARNFDICKKYAGEFSAAGGNLLLNGSTGLGKTMLSACIARVVTEKGFSVAYESAPHLFAKLESNHFRPDEETRLAVAPFRSCDLLIIDDLGTELPGNFVTAALYTLINDRLLAGKPMIISTNLTIGEIRERYSPQIASRLQGSFQLLPFLGEDIRVLKNK